MGINHTHSLTGIWLSEPTKKKKQLAEFYRDLAIDSANDGFDAKHFGLAIVANGRIFSHHWDMCPYDAVDTEEYKEFIDIFVKSSDKKFSGIFGSALAKGSYYPSPELGSPVVYDNFVLLHDGKINNPDKIASENKLAKLSDDTNGTNILARAIATNEIFKLEAKEAIETWKGIIRYTFGFYTTFGVSVDGKLIVSGDTNNLYLGCMPDLDNAVVISSDESAIKDSAVDYTLYLNFFRKVTPKYSVCIEKVASPGVMYGTSGFGGKAVIKELTK